LTTTAAAAADLRLSGFLLLFFYTLVYKFDEIETLHKHSPFSFSFRNLGSLHEHRFADATDLQVLAFDFFRVFLGTHAQLRVRVLSVHSEMDGVAGLETN